jgi:hypothetical protein
MSGEAKSLKPKAIYRSSVQSIMGATLMRRSMKPLPSSVGSLCISGSLLVVEEPYGRVEPLPIARSQPSSRRYSCRYRVRAIEPRRPGTCADCWLYSSR